jgi:energy-coupling factor transporter ATP-binding protein EcfA2
MYHWMDSWGVLDPRARRGCARRREARESAADRTEKPLVTAATKGGCDERLNRLLLASRRRLSGGEKQLVAVAGAIANRPQLILADEPTANLDSQRGQETMRLLRRLANEEGATVLIVSHNERLRAIADRVLWLEDGRFKEIAALEREPVAGCWSIPSKQSGSSGRRHLVVRCRRLPRAVRARTRVGAEIPDSRG